MRNQDPSPKAHWVVALLGLWCWAPPAQAGTFSNSTPIIIPGVGTGAGTGAPASPYPSVISIAGVPANEVISSLTVTLRDFTHPFPDDVDVLLIGPNGARVLLMSDCGASLGVTAINLTFDDSAGALPDAALITSGTYSPTNYGVPDAFPAPVPAAVHGSALATFADVQPNGEWRLFVVDDAEFDLGTIAGGWTLEFTTLVTLCGNGIIETGEDCDEGDFVAGDGCGPTCLFETCGNGFVDPGEGCDDGNLINGDGCTALCSIEFCGDGIVQEGIGETCEDGNTIGGDGCSAICGTEVCGNSIIDPGEDCDDGNAVACDGCDGCSRVGPPFCNPTTIVIPAPPGTVSPSSAEPYPSVIAVTGIPVGHVVSALTITLLDFSHTNSDDVDVVLVGPDGTNVFLMSDVGGSTDVTSIDLTFADGGLQLPDNTVIVAGTYAPTNSGTPDQAFPAPAPPGPYGSTLSAFIGSDPTGRWSLYVVDDIANFEGGTIGSGWTLNLSTAFAQCGNGEVEPGEGCDDGNTIGGDGCSSICGTEVCGNGIVDPGEDCDDGNAVACDGCDECAVEAPAVCGNGVTECGEECDDANANETDGCLADCAQGAAVPPSPPGCPAVSISAYSSMDTPLPINAFGTPTITSTIAVAGADPYVFDVNVTTTIRHTNSGDLDITLTSPFGTSITLTTDNANGFRDVFNGTAWDAAADTKFSAPHLPGVSKLVTDALYSNGVAKAFLTPEESLGAFNGEDPNGLWTLTGSDDADFNGGDLLGWTLSIATLAPAPTRVVLPPVASTPGLVIPTGPAVVSDSITFAGAGISIGEVKVFTDITHTLNADLDIILTSPRGTSVTLTTDNAGPNDDVLAGTLWDDTADPGNPAPYPHPNSASNLVTDTAYTNLVAKPTLTPEEPLATFNGEDPNGTWTLTIRDDAGPNGGTLNSWSLSIATYSCDAPQLCDLPLGNDREDPCFQHQDDCVGGGDLELCLPKRVLRNGQSPPPFHVLASLCGCYLDACGPVRIDEFFITCTGVCAGEACTVFEDELPLNRPTLPVDMMSFTRSYTCGCAGTPVPGDTDGDRDVDLRDLSTFIPCFGLSPLPPECASSDVDGDGDVDRDDLVALLDNYNGPTSP